VFSAIKCNIGPRAPSLAYVIDESSVENIAQGAQGGSAAIKTSRVRWIGTSEQTADTLLAARAKDDNPTATDAAAAILADILAKGPVAEPEARKQAKRAGVSHKSYWNARRRLKVATRKEGFSGGWIIELPDENGAVP
jgi:hypothetical protein